MSYMIHLTKADNRFESKEKPISSEELEQLINEDSELELRNGMSIKNPQSGSTITIPGTFIVWKKKEYDVWYRYSGGEISCSHEEDGRIDKLKELGQKLNAKVFGDEGEEY